MAIERSTPRTNAIDVLDRVLDKGVVIDAQVRVSVVGLHLVDIDARVIVASIQTYVRHAAEIVEVQRQASLASLAERRPPSVLPLEPTRRRAPVRRPRRRRTPALIAYRCQLGCTFWRSRRSAQSRVAAVTCPYEADTTCALERV